MFAYCLFRDSSKSRSRARKHRAGRTALQNMNHSEPSSKDVTKNHTQNKTPENASGEPAAESRLPVLFIYSKLKLVQHCYLFLFWFCHTSSGSSELSEKYNWSGAPAACRWRRARPRAGSAILPAPQPRGHRKRQPSRAAGTPA